MLNIYWLDSIFFARKTSAQSGMSSNLECNDLDIDSDLEVDCSPYFVQPPDEVIGSIHGQIARDPPLKKGLGLGYDSYDSGVGESIKSQDFTRQFKNLQISSVENTECCDVQIKSEQSEKSDNCVGQEAIVYAQDSEGDTQLHLATIQQIPQLCLYFINIVTNFNLLNIQNDLMQTVLHLAVMTKMPQIVRRLIVAGADVTYRDHRGDTPLHIAARDGDTQTVRILLEPVSYEETLQNSYKIPYQKIPQNLELRNYNGQTCLQVAAEGSHLEVINLLLSKGSDINTMDGKSGRTVLHYAAECNNRPLLEYLLTHYRVKVDARTYGGQTPLMLAQGRGHNSIVQRLMQAGAVFQHPREDSDSDDEMDECYT